MKVAGPVHRGTKRIYLIQGLRHAYKNDLRYRYLGERAIRIRVSREIADAIGATGWTNDPVLTIPNSIDVTPFEPGPVSSTKA